VDFADFGAFLGGHLACEMPTLAVITQPKYGPCTWPWNFSRYLVCITGGSKVVEMEVNWALNSQSRRLPGQPARRPYRRSNHLLRQ
jgi:hypothetical protein